MWVVGIKSAVSGAPIRRYSYNPSLVVYTARVHEDGTQLFDDEAAARIACAAANERQTVLGEHFKSLHSDDSRHVNEFVLGHYVGIQPYVVMTVKEADELEQQYYTDSLSHLTSCQADWRRRLDAAIAAEEIHRLQRKSFTY